MSAPQDDSFFRRNLLFGCGAEIVIPLVVALIVGLYLLLAD
jgi:hypothetical protein